MPWPWPTPAGAASARGGVPHPWNGAVAEWRGGGAAQRRSAQAQRGRLGCLLSRARDGVPQEAWFPCFARSAERCFGCCFWDGRCGQGTRLLRNLVETHWRLFRFFSVRISPEKLLISRSTSRGTQRRDGRLGIPPSHLFYPHSGQYGFLLIEPRKSGDYDREVFLGLHDWGGLFPAAMTARCHGTLAQVISLEGVRLAVWATISRAQITAS